MLLDVFLRSGSRFCTPSECFEKSGFTCLPASTVVFAGGSDGPNMSYAHASSHVCSRSEFFIDAIFLSRKMRHIAEPSDSWSQMPAPSTRFSKPRRSRSSMPSTFASSRKRHALSSSPSHSAHVCRVARAAAAERAEPDARAAATAATPTRRERDRREAPRRARLKLRVGAHRKMTRSEMLEVLSCTPSFRIQMSERL